MRALTLMAIGFALLLAGFLVPFLMVLRVLEPGFALSFSSHLASLTGLLVALYGIWQYKGSTRDNDR